MSGENRKDTNEPTPEEKPELSTSAAAPDIIWESFSYVQSAQKDERDS